VTCFCEGGQPIVASVQESTGVLSEPQGFEPQRHVSLSWQQIGPLQVELVAGPS
jgi:hypothetical protein